MTVKEIVKVIKGKELTPPIKDESFEFKHAFSGDLMSDALMVLREADEEFCETGLLITGNITMQSVRTAEMLDFAGILITRGKVPTEQVLQQAYESGIVVIGTNYLSFTTCGLLHENGIRGFKEE
ncbi:MAG: hypothetical protein ACI32E_02685 [Bacilli bacterium]